MPVEHILVVRVSRVLDEDGVIDTGCVHVVEQGFYWFVFVKSNMAVCIDNGHCVFAPEGMGSKQCALFRAVVWVSGSLACHLSGY